MKWFKNPFRHLSILEMVRIQHRDTVESHMEACTQAEFWLSRKEMLETRLERLVDLIGGME
ncbi:hypothetical protein UFOVP2_12 [uncultured Caudovirales phage]|uniref:Uncharacterized protein n=1 Tax=uncultured Caudovirales phage TaxID=2100421 RepID=A0A6J5KFY1_9CAUD|nr:hypothetical protein UFOVP2_12 [uncultured Caudovirales phage]